MKMFFFIITFGCLIFWAIGYFVMDAGYLIHGLLFIAFIASLLYIIQPSKKKDHGRN
jgi:hypothetical protein